MVHCATKANIMKLTEGYIKKTFEEIAEKLGPPDILVNSAGIIREGYFERLARRDFRDVMDINFFGTVHCIQAVLPFFKKKGGGRVVNISSMAGLIGTFGYTISTMHCMTVSLAQGGAGLGTMWGEELAETMVQDAGFTNLRKHKLEHDFINVYYVMSKD